MRGKKSSFSGRVSFPFVALSLLPCLTCAALGRQVSRTIDSTDGQGHYIQ